MTKPSIPFPVEQGYPLRRITSLKAGGSAEFFVQCRTRDQLADAVIWAHHNMHSTILAGGSNVLPSDAGVPGLTIANLTRQMEIKSNGDIEADTGVMLQELFLKTAQQSFDGLQFAVGIPGSLGGALVSNAGAYQNNVSAFLTELEVIDHGVRRWVGPEIMQFSYRDSILRSENPPDLVVIAVRMHLNKGKGKDIYEEAREYQRQRISKQPPPASAGSFFKNVNDAQIADRLPDLPEKLKLAGVVPAGYLIQNCGLRGHRVGGASVGVKHANFLLNTRNGSAYDIRDLANLVKQKVKAEFGVLLEEEVLYLGDWSEYLRTRGSSN